MGRALVMICASIGTARLSARARLASKRACSRSSSARFDLATASSWRSLHLVAAGADDARLHVVEALACTDGLAQGGDLSALLDALDDLADLALDLALQTIEIGVELAHARMRRQQRRRQLGELPLERARAAARGSG